MRVLFVGIAADQHGGNAPLRQFLYQWLGTRTIEVGIHDRQVDLAILDQFGEPIYFYRMDGQGRQGIETAFLKAKTSLNTRQPSRAVANAVARGGAVQWRGAEKN